MTLKTPKKRPPTGMVVEDALRWNRGAALMGLFLLSGATSLVYQILWVRELSLSLGSTVYAISIVVSAFMAGLAIGSAFFGGRADRWGSPLRLYALLEGGIGVCALLAPIAFRGIAAAAAASPDALAPSAATKWLPFAASFVVLLVPTTLMGGTLPVLSRYVASFRGSRGALIGALYSVNTIGAIVGTAVTGFVLIRLVGIRNATHLAALGNFVILAVAVLLSRVWPGTRVAPAAGTASTAVDAGGAVTTGASAAARAEDASRWLLGPVTLVYFVNGLAGLAFELLWTRAIVLFATNTIYAFTVILTTFLFGLGLGSSVMSAFVSRVRRPHALLGGFQCLVALIAALTPLALSRVGLPIFEAAGDATKPLALAGEVVTAYAVAVLFMLPATILMGASFPLVARIVAGGTERVGRAVGRVYALNTVGAVLGSLLAAFLFLPLIGVQRSILLFALVSAASGFYLAMRAGARNWRVVGGAGAAVIILLLALSPNHFRGMLERSLGAELTFYREGVETTVSVYESERAKRPVLVINSMALDDRGVVHKLLAHLPALFHPEPKRALVLGFGVGISSESISAHGIEVNDCVEISPAVMDAAHCFAGLNGNIAARGDPRFTVYETDGRRLLLSRPDPYDLIILDANSGNLRNAGVGKLYTTDFFELCKERLTSNGMVTLYASPNGTLREFKMIARTFQEVFPHTTLWVDRVFGQTSVLLGSREPLRIDLDRYLARLARPAVQADLAVFDLDQPGLLLSCFMMGEELLRVFAADGELNTDDHPIMEFYPLDIGIFDADDRPVSDIGFLLFRESVRDRLLANPDSPETAEIMAYLEAEERVSHSLIESWIHGWFGNQSDALASARVAASLHPGAEYLRSRLGFGRRDLAAASAAADTGATPNALARLAAIRMRRGEYDQASRDFERAIAARLEAFPGDSSSELAGLYIGAARCERELRRLTRTREYLAIAAGMGSDVSLDRLEVDLVEASGDRARTASLLREVVEAAFRRMDIIRAREALTDLRELGATDAQHHLREARCLEAFGDFAGAYLSYRDVAEMEPSLAEAVAGVQRCGLELALRADIMTDTYGSRDARPASFASPFREGRVAFAELPVRQHDDAGPWLDLSTRYAQSGRSVEAYRKARAARTLAPRRPETYMAVGAAAAQVGNLSVARAAFETALRLNAGFEPARNALRRLGQTASAGG